MKYDATMLDIGSDKQIFVDDLIIESAENVCRSWHQPVRASDSPVIKEDKPWEHIVYFTFNGSQVIRDPKDGLFKCIYQIWESGDFPPLGMGDHHLLYAESEDGIHWHKPLLDLHKVNEEPTNIIIPNALGMSYVLNPHEQDVSQRFKALYLSYQPTQRSRRPSCGRGFWRSDPLDEDA